MKKAFILPIVLILLALLIAATLTLGYLTSSKTGNLSAQKEGFYFEKKMKQGDKFEKLYHREDITILYGKPEIIEVSDFFSDGLRTYPSSGRWNGGIEFDGGTKYRNNYSKYVPANYVDNSGRNPCRDTQDGKPDSPCAADEIKWMRSKKLNLPNFERSSGNDVTITGGSHYFDGSEDVGVINITGNYSDIYFDGKVSKEYRIKGINANREATYYFAPGDYWIEDLKITSQSKIEVTGSRGSVRIYLKESPKFGNGKVEVNTSGGSNRILFVSYNDFEVSQGFQMNGAIYSEEDVVIRSDVDFKGSVVAKNIEFTNWSQMITYDKDATKIDLGQVKGWIED